MLAITLRRGSRYVRNLLEADFSLAYHNFAGWGVKRQVPHRLVQLRDSARLPANVEVEGLAASELKQYSFRLNLINREGEGPAADRIVSRRVSAAGLHASRDSLYRTARDTRQP